MVKKVLSLICSLFLFIACCGCHSEIINLDYETLKDSVKSIEIVKILYEDALKLELVKEISEEEKTSLLKDLENIDFYVAIYGDPRSTINYLAIKINFTQENYYLITEVAFEYDIDGEYLIRQTNPYHKGTNTYYDINALINKYLTNGDGGDL